MNRFILAGVFLLGGSVSIAQDLAPDRLSNAVIEYMRESIPPFPPTSGFFCDNGVSYGIEPGRPAGPLVFPFRFEWRKTGPTTATLTDITPAGRAETNFTFVTASSGTYRNMGGRGFGTFRLTTYSVPPGPTLRNASARVPLAPGQVTTTGFVVSGGTPRRVLVRLIGPGLTQFGVGNAVARPVLTLLKDGMTIATNSGWGGVPATAAAFVAVGAFALPAASADCALVLLLDAGNYSAQARADTAGEALLEVYFVD